MIVKNIKPKILLWDIESSHNLVLAFGLYDQDIPHENIKIDRHLYCVSYKWYGEKTIKTLSITDDKKRFKKNHHDDFYVVSEFRKVMEQADAQVGHYSSRFDLPMLNARIIANGLQPLPNIISLDTKNLASKYFRFNSNKLDYISKLLGHKGKMETPKDLWLKCFDGDIGALNTMAKYNRQDVDALEFVFRKLIPFIKNNPLNTGMFLDGAVCPTCGSVKLEWRGWTYTRVGKFRRFVCKDCGHWSTERKCEKLIKTSPVLK